MLQSLDQTMAIVKCEFSHVFLSSTLQLRVLITGHRLELSPVIYLRAVSLHSTQCSVLSSTRQCAEHSWPGLVRRRSPPGFTGCGLLTGLFSGTAPLSFASCACTAPLIRVSMCFVSSLVPCKYTVGMVPDQEILDQKPFLQVWSEMK